MPTEALSSKKEAICEHGPEAPSCPVGQGSFKMDCFKVEECSMIRRVKFDILVGNHGRHVLRAKEEGDLPACYQCSVQKPTSLIIWGFIIANGMGSLHVLGGTLKVYKGLEQHMLPSRRCVFQQDNAKPHIAAITTAWLRSRRVRVLNLSPIENIWRIIKRKIRQRWPADGNPYQARMGANSNT